jgi:hypothetical protein
MRDEALAVKRSTTMVVQREADMRKAANGWAVLMQDDIDAMMEGAEVRIPEGCYKLMMHADVVERMRADYEYYKGEDSDAHL